MPKGVPNKKVGSAPAPVETNGVSADSRVYELSTGYEFTARPVGSMIIYDAQNDLKFPDPPKVKITQKGESWWQDNPNDSRYVARCEEIQRDRNMAALTVMIEWGIKLHSPLPADESWLDKIRRRINLSGYEDDQGQIKADDKEYLFLRYIAISTKEDYELVASCVSLTEAEVSEVTDSFSGDEA